MEPEHQEGEVPSAESPPAEPAPIEPPKAESSAEPPRALAVGDRVSGTLSQMEPVGILTLADGRKLSIDPAELAGSGESSQPGPQLGEPFEAFVVKIDPSGDAWVSSAKGSAALLLLEDAKTRDLPVTGRVVAHGPRGLDVDLGAGILALCPTAEIGRPGENPGHLVGETLEFRVKDVGREVILSRKLAQQGGARRKEIAQEVRLNLVRGAVLPGKVVSLRDFGAFVDLGGGVEGLVHLSELSHERVSNPKDVVAVGQEVQVQVLKVDYDAHKGERIALSLKALQKSAWDRALAELKEGQTLKGKVASIKEFGAFVELSPGVQGLVHQTELGTKRRIAPAEVVKEGEEIEVEILGLDPEKKRISLRRVPPAEEVAAAKAQAKERRDKRRADEKERRERAKQKPWERLKPGDVVDGSVDRIEPYGLFIALRGGGRGMVHQSEIGPPPQAPEGKGHQPLAEQFSKGAKIRVAILDIDSDHKIRLSRAAVEKIEGGMSAETYVKQKAERELAEKLLRSADKPAPRRPERGAKRPVRNGEASPRGRAQASSSAEPRGEGKSDPRSEGRPGAKPRGKPRPPDPRGLKGPSKGVSLGTLGDLFKAKLAQKK
jgi:small subunit ribosomal protein S1